MTASPPLTLAERFASLDDPRVDRHPEGTRLHPLLSIVASAICAVIGGAEMASHPKCQPGLAFLINSPVEQSLNENGVTRTANGKEL